MGQYYRHYLLLTAAIALGALLRFALLNFKALWLDEVITALFSSGHSYKEIPLDQVFSLSQLQRIFTLNYQANCSLIADNLTMESTHPPLFFCLTNQWLNWVGKNTIPATPLWVWQLRFIPAFFGVAAILAVYLLTRAAFSAKAGLIAAFVMAVSPFGVYLSQEARHYTLPVFLIALSLTAFLKIQKDLFSQQRVKFWVAIAWVVINTIGIYTHYFFSIGMFAQILIIFTIAIKQKLNLSKYFVKKKYRLTPWQFPTFLYFFVYYHLFFICLGYPD